MKLTSILIVCLLLLPTVMAVSNAEIKYDIEQYESLNLRFTCTNEFTGLPCDSTFACNMSVKYPDQRLMINNLPTTRNVVDYNITIPDTSIIGIYEYNPYCYNATAGGTPVDPLYYKVSPLGNSNSLGFFILITAVLYILLFFFAYNENAPLTTLLGAGLIVWGIFMVINGIGDFKNLATDSFAYITFAIGAFFATMGGIQTIKEGLD